MASERNGSISADLGGDAFLKLLLRQFAGLQGRADAILAALVQTSGSPLLAPLPRAIGGRGLINVVASQVVVNTASMQVLPANMQRRRLFFQPNTVPNAFIGPGSYVNGATQTGIPFSGTTGNYLLVNEETWGEVLRQPWFGGIQFGSYTLNIIEESVI